MEIVVKNFSTEELKCKCGCGKLKLDPRLLIALQQLRDRIGAPIFVNSGYRCPEHNEAVGGKPGSQHVKGRAADITCPSISISDLANEAEKVGYFAAGGIGRYFDKRFVHVDVRYDGSARWVG